MKKKRILKWLLGLFLLGVLVIVACFLLRDTFARWAVQRSIESQTGLKTRLGAFHIGPDSVTISDLKLYNTADFGGTLFLAIPEIHFEFDRDAALSKGQIHLTLLRFNLGELDIIKNEAGRTNLFELGVALPSKDSLSQSKDLAQLKKRTGFEFTGIDLLTVSVGTARFIDQQDPKNSREENIDIENIPLRNVKAEADLVGLMALVALKGSDVFGALVDKHAAGGNTQLLNSLF